MIVDKTGSWFTQVELSADGKEATIHHVENNNDTAALAKFIASNSDRGFSKDRQYQCLGYMPMSVFFGQGFHKRPPEDITKWLESDEATPYRVTRQNTGKDPRIIIK